MRSSVLVACLLSLLFISSSYAGGNVSGGGNSLICFFSQETANQARAGGLRDEHLNPSLVDTITFVDEMDTERSFSSRLLDSSDRWALSREVERVVGVHFPEFGQKMAEVRTLLEGGIEWVDQSLPLISDMDESDPMETDRCVLATTARNTLRDGQDVQLEIDRRIFQHVKFSERSRKILFLHEQLYIVMRLSRSDGTDSSAAVRHLVSVLSRRTRVSVGNLDELLQALGTGGSRFERISFEGFRAVVHEVAPFASGRPGVQVSEVLSQSSSLEAARVCRVVPELPPRLCEQSVAEAFVRGGDAYLSASVFGEDSPFVSSLFFTEVFEEILRGTGYATSTFVDLSSLQER